MARSKNLLTTLAFDELAAVVYNAVKIDAVNAVEARFVKEQIFRVGRVGYDKVTGYFASIAAAGINEYGNPKTATFIHANGISFMRNLSYDENPSGAYLLRSTPNEYRIFDSLDLTADLMTLCTRAIRQNIRANMRPQIVIGDSDTIKTVKTAVKKAEDGASVLFVESDIARALQGIENKNVLQADKFLYLRQAIRNEFLTQIGILTANNTKRERVQATEVYAGLNEAVDNIYSIIDYWNDQCESYDLPFKMSFNGSIEELYEEPKDTTPNNDLKDVQI